MGTSSLDNILSHTFFDFQLKPLFRKQNSKSHTTDKVLRATPTLEHLAEWS